MDGQTDGGTGMTKLIVASRNCANAPDNGHYNTSSDVIPEITCRQSTKRQKKFGKTS